MFLQHGYNKWSKEVKCHESQKIESEDMQMRKQGDEWMCKRSCKRMKRGDEKTIFG